MHQIDSHIISGASGSERHSSRKWADREGRRSVAGSGKVVRVTRSAAKGAMTIQHVPASRHSVQIQIVSRPCSFFSAFLFFLGGAGAAADAAATSWPRFALLLPLSRASVASIISFVIVILPDSPECAAPRRLRPAACGSASKGKSRPLRVISHLNNEERERPDKMARPGAAERAKKAKKTGGTLPVCGHFARFGDGSLAPLLREGEDEMAMLKLPCRFPSNRAANFSFA